MFQSVVHLKRKASHRPIHRYACTQTSLQLPRIQAEKKDIILNPETKRSATGQQNESVICGILHVRGSPAGRSQKRIYTDLQHQLPAAFAMIELDHLILPPPLATVFERDLTTTTLAPPWPFPAQLPRNPCGTSALSGQLGTGKAGLF